MIMMSKLTPNEEICGAGTDLDRDKTHIKNEMVNQKGKGHLGDLSVDGRIKIK
jgi:hypothetical protein